MTAKNQHIFKSNLISQKRVKIPNPNLHPCCPANSFITKFKVDLIHRLVKPDAFLVILEQVDLVTTRSQLAQSHAYQPDITMFVPGAFQEVLYAGYQDVFCRS